MEHWRAVGAAFAVGFVGWLLVGALHAESFALFGAAGALGAIAAVATRRLSAIAGLLVGGLAAYPAALALGTIAFLGENWAIDVVVFAAFAMAGFGVGLLLVRSDQVGSTRSRANR